MSFLNKKIKIENSIDRMLDYLIENKHIDQVNVFEQVAGYKFDGDQLEDDISERIYNIWNELSYKEKKNIYDKYWK